MLTVSAVAILSESYKKIGDIGYTIVQNMKDGLEGSPSQNVLYQKLIKSCILYERILKHIVLNDNKDKILAVYGITSIELNRLLFCLRDISGVYQLPATPLPVRVYETSLIGQGVQGPPGIAGQSSYVYVRYASDANGTDYSATPSPSRRFISIKSSNVPLPDVVATHAGNWAEYIGVGVQGVAGDNGTSSYTFQAWADDASGTGFTLTFDANKKYTAFLTKDNNTVPIVGDFAGKWGKYIGENGSNGTNGTNGNTILYGTIDPGPTDGVDGDSYLNTTTLTLFVKKTAGVWPAGTSIAPLPGPPGADGEPGTSGIDGENGVSSYIYIAYADDIVGTGYILVQSNDSDASLTAFNINKKYIGILTSDTAIGADITAENFATLWSKYAGDGDRWSTTSTTSLTIGVGLHSLTVETGLAYVTGQRTVIAVDSQPDKKMEGYCVNYNTLTGQLAVEVDTITGAGTYSTWDVSLQASLPNANEFAFENASVNIATSPNVVDSFSSSIAKRIRWEYLIEKGANSAGRALTVVINGTTIEGSETSAGADIGTIDVTMDVDISGSDIRLLATTTSDSWLVKGIRRIIA